MTKDTFANVIRGIAGTPKAEVRAEAAKEKQRRAAKKKPRKKKP